MNPERSNLVRQVQLQELYLLHHDHRENPRRLDIMLAPEFREIAADGSIVERSEVIAWLMKKNPVARWEMLECRGEVLSSSLVMLVYLARQVKGVDKVSAGSWRSSLWRKPRGSEDWELLFHQATAVR